MEMKKYHLLMNGRNFLVDMDGKIAKRGFLQNFFLEAKSPAEAETLAVQKIRGNEDLRAITRNPKDDPPVIVLDEMSELESFDGVEAMESGKAWYQEKKWWQFWR
jgi:hypothetical protein